MVGYGETLLRSKRPGWESAYINYDNLKSIVEEVERLYQSLEETPTPTASYDSEHESLLVEEGIVSVDEAATLEKASQLSEQFLRALRNQVEKISLFALSRQGELADAVGSLRFNSHLGGDEEEVEIMEDKKTPILKDSKVSTSYGSLAITSSESNVDSTTNSIEAGSVSPYVDELSFLLPQISSQAADKDGLRDVSEKFPRPMFAGKTVLELTERASSISNSLIASDMNRDGNGHANDWENGDIGNGKDSSSSVVLDPYSLVGVELLHLLRFICVNSMGVRKILKKYDSVVEKYADSNDEKLREALNTISPFLQTFSFRADQGPDVHLQQLTNSDSIAAITLSLLKSLMNTRSPNELAELEQKLVQDTPLLRFKCAIDSIDILREYANIANQPFPAFLSRQAMVVTGYDLGGIEGMRQNALEVLLAFDPDTILHMKKLDLSEWHLRCWSYTFTAAGNKMRKTSFDLIETPDPIPQDRKLSWGGVDGPSMFINLMSILLYTVNYYIVSPTANRYAQHLGFNGAIGSTVIGASSLAALFSALLYSLWYSKFSMKSALIFSTLCPIAGNALYVVALSRQSLKMALLGRLLVGFGSAEVINRQMISSCVHLNYMTKASVEFVVTGALGMSIGPLLAAIIDKYVGRDFRIDFELPHVGNIIFDYASSPAYLMVALWVIQLFAIIFGFNEPFRINRRNEMKKKKSGESFASKFQWGVGLVFRNPALPLTLFIFLYIGMVCEILISSCALISDNYFGWTASIAGFFIACLGAFVIPAHFFAERTSRSFDERAIMKFSLIFIVVALFGVVNYEEVYNDIVVSSSHVEHTSVKTWHTVKNTSIHDWDILQDPNTWESLWNDTKKDWKNFENMTAEEWIIFKNATVHEWEALEEEGAEEWETLGNETKDMYSHLANSTKEEWIKLVNETEDGWEKLSDATKKEWKLLPNQTKEEWHKINDGAHDEWHKIEDGTGTMWHKVENSAEDTFHAAKDATSKAVDTVEHKAGDVRDATSSKWSEVSSGVSKAMGGVVNASSNIVHATSEKTQEVLHHKSLKRKLLQKRYQFKAYDFGWGYYAYVIGVSCAFLGIIILEGVDTSLMCKSAPSQLNSSFINVGLLATMIGALGRVLGNGIVTLSAWILTEYTDLVNVIFIPLIPITFMSLHYVRKFYDHLV